MYILYVYLYDTFEKNITPQIDSKKKYVNKNAAVI